MKPIKAWAIVQKSTGDIFKDSINGGRKWDLAIFEPQGNSAIGLMDDFEIVRVEIREMKPKKKDRT